MKCFILSSASLLFALTAVIPVVEATTGVPSPEADRQTLSEKAQIDATIVEWRWDNVEI
ncbi:MAG: hypothetical protein AAFR42_01825 [Cyanobacteria bacterium J06628_6]